jgi:hypothetical protein
MKNTEFKKLTKYQIDLIVTTWNKLKKPSYRKVAIML